MILKTATSTNEQFRQICRQRIRDLGISACEIAARAGMPRQPFQRLISEAPAHQSTRVSLETAVAAAKVLGISLDKLKA